MTGVLFLDMISNMEKIGDHLTNIAERVDTNGEDQRGTGIAPVDEGTFTLVSFRSCQCT